MVQAAENPGFPSAVAVAPDGSVIVAANNEQIPTTLFHFSADGRRVGFGTRHEPARIAMGGSLCLPGLAVKPDGTIVVACGDEIAYLAPSGRVRMLVSLPGADLRRVVVDAYGRTLAVGNEMVRLLPNGQFDASFGINGTASLAAPATSLALTGTRIVVVTDSGLVREYFDDGSPDMTLAAPVGFKADTVVANDRWIYAGGSTGLAAAIVRFSPDGSIDTTFGDHGTAGWIATQSTQQVVALGIRAGGTLDAAVQLDLGWMSDNGDEAMGWLVQRVLLTGELGIVAPGPDFIDSHGCDNEVPEELAEQPNGKTVVAGVACWGATGTMYSLALRYGSALVLDEGVPLRIRARPTVFHSRTMTVHLSVNGPCRIVAEVGGLRETTIDVNHAGPVNVRVWAGFVRPRAVDVHAYDARGYPQELVVKPAGAG